MRPASAQTIKHEQTTTSTFLSASNGCWHTQLSNNRTIRKTLVALLSRCGFLKGLYLPVSIVIPAESTIQFLQTTRQDQVLLDE